MWFNIFKREKGKVEGIVENNFCDNWKQEHYEKNVLEGVEHLKKGNPIRIYDDGRGYELAIDIKRRFILEKQKQLSEKIRIENSGNIITIKQSSWTDIQ